MATQPLSESPYVVLSIARSASAEEVRKAYKQKLLETHPDKLPLTATEEEKQRAQDRFRHVQEAFEILNDPIKRKAYDIHVRPLPDHVPKKWDTGFELDHTRRAKDRKEWAKKNELKQQDRMKTFNEVAEEQCKATAVKAAMVEAMLQELYQLNPEWEIRKKKAQAWKASRVKGPA